MGSLRPADFETQADRDRNLGVDLGMSDLTNVAVICPGCNSRVRLADFQISIHHCDDCEIEASIAMQTTHDITEAEAQEMAAYYGEDS